jgi:hypothetical protein
MRAIMERDALTQKARRISPEGAQSLSESYFGNMLPAV